MFQKFVGTREEILEAAKKEARVCGDKLNISSNRAEIYNWHQSGVRWVGVWEEAYVQKHMRHGCCKDGKCTPGTCMELPTGKTCGGCANVVTCTKLFGVETTNTWCDWFPRKYVEASRG